MSPVSARPSHVTALVELGLPLDSLAVRAWAAAEQLEAAKELLLGGDHVSASSELSVGLFCLLSIMGEIEAPDLEKWSQEQGQAA